jgi:hypothetical protein
VPVIVCNKSLTNCTVHEQLVFHNEVDVNGKRIVPRGNLLAIEESFVLDKPNRKYEPKKNTMILEDGEERLYDFNNDDDTYTLIISDGSEFVFTADNVVEFDVSMMPGRTQILKCLQKGWMLEHFSIPVSSQTIYPSNSSSNARCITDLINKGNFTFVCKDRNVRIVKLASNQQFPVSM